MWLKKIANRLNQAYVENKHNVKFLLKEHNKVASYITIKGNTPEAIAAALVDIPFPNQTMIFIPLAARLEPEIAIQLKQNNLQIAFTNSPSKSVVLLDKNQLYIFVHIIMNSRMLSKEYLGFHRSVASRY